MHELTAEFPPKPIDEIENLPRRIEVVVDVQGPVGRGGEVVDEDVEVDGVVVVVCGGEGVEAAGEGGDAVVGEDFDDESEAFVVGGGGGWGLEVGGLRLGGGVSGDGGGDWGGRGEREEKEGGEREEDEEWDQILEVLLRLRHARDLQAYVVDN